jgi:hypothetical protein
VLDAWLPWARVLVGLAALLTLFARAAHDPRRAKEYGFLAATTAAAAAYGIAHDRITATLSPEYFLLFKGLADDPRPFRVAVTLLAVRASWWTGALAGAALLVANNPRPGGQPPQLPYAALARLAAIPFTLAALTATLFGAVNAADPLGLSATARALVAPDRVRAFLVVWGAHAGSYVGGLVGVVCASAAIVVRRRPRV